MNRIVGFLLVGLIAGWLAGRITKGRGFGLWGNLIVGVVGAVVGGFVFRTLGLAAYGTLGGLVMAVVGAILLLYLVRVIKSA